MAKKDKMSAELLILLILSSAFGKNIDDILNDLKSENEAVYEEFKALVEDNNFREILDNYKIKK